MDQQRSMATTLSATATQLDDQECWEKVSARDSTGDGRFVYAVRSTGVYCRPSCPSRRPQRGQVVYFLLPAEAEAAGFRACRRCHPDVARAPEPNADLVDQVCDYIDGHLDEGVTLNELSDLVHLSPFHLQRTFKRLRGMTPRQYAESRRASRLRESLQEGMDVTSAVYDAGYTSSSNAYRGAPVHLGMTPGVYRAGGKGVKMAYAIEETPLGYALVAATERGVAAVRFGDSSEGLHEVLEAEFPLAERRRDEETVRPWMAALQAHLRGEPADPEVPLDLQASAFRMKVWEALKDIPAGTTRSYGEVAEAVGQPGAARAVAQACASNPVAVFVPCHRVVRGNGDLGGYRWGVERKRKLLSLEREANKTVTGTLS